jgi:hypothetical protein
VSKVCQAKSRDRITGAGWIARNGGTPTTDPQDYIDG